MSSISKQIIIRVSLVILAIIMLILLFFIGVRIGYVTLGKGHPSDTFKAETWQHILDFIK
ncbi:DNA-directed RNA polymerase subunit beta [Vagococcus fluvialis]|uniref:DNA-directed RNA polymerase subunit beta n=1 Tax=Vagococcus fluvialis TaxID=2738 RepID=UPI001A8EA5DB|nr:DNA-directed RNA polymerase subunit beta [Vagococcus fluvialis]MBO0427704.1 DNA-directed RNA polymerase subunit beta [Vagococcus fluvialis]